jgi:hypothetical protein
LAMYQPEQLLAEDLNQHRRRRLPCSSNGTTPYRAA